MYGHRGRSPDVYYLSPYEFERYWDIKLLSYPKALKGLDNPKHHVHMTEAGLKKLSALEGPQCLANLDLKPGIDYKDGRRRLRRQLASFPRHGGLAPLPSPVDDGSSQQAVRAVLCRLADAASRGFRRVTECDDHNDILPPLGPGREHGFRARAACQPPPRRWKVLDRQP